MLTIEVTPVIADQPQVDFCVDLNNNDVSIEAIAVAQYIMPGDYNFYEGEYEVRPSFDRQSLETTDKILTDDVVVTPIQVQRTSNPQGGTTIYIGGIIENGQ